jgi:hypothetical protein
VARPPAAEEAARKLEPILDSIVERHRTALRVAAIASIAFGLFTLYAVAAVLSRDRNGRRLALLTAAFGIIYQLGGLPLQMRIAKEMVAAGLGEIMTAAGQGAGRTEAQLITTLYIAAALLAAVGVGWCVLLGWYFGGRRGRELYGLPRRSSS